jgi:ABC-type phosphate transport system substrate-binding protein
MKKNLSIAHWIQASACIALVTCGAAHAADIVVVVNPASTLTKEQVPDVFLGKNTSSTPVDLPESSPVRAAFYSKATGKEAAQVKAAWARLVFSGKAQPPKELPDAGAVKKAVAADPKSVGYIEKSAVDASVKVLTTVE